MSDVINEQVEGPAVEPVVEAEQSGEDPLLAAIESGFQELERAEALRDGREAEPEPESSEETVDWAELQRLDAESGQSAWRQEQQEQRSAAEDFQQWQSAEQTAAAEAQYEQRRDEIFGDVLSRLDDAYEMEDSAAIIHLADEVSQHGDPQMFTDYLTAWDAVDPVSARQYEAAYRARAFEASQAEWVQQQRYAEIADAAAQDEYARALAAEQQQQQAANAAAMSNEITRLSKDPAFGKLADTVVSIATPMFQEWQGNLTPEIASGLVQSAYENAVALQSAKANAPFLSALDAQLHHQELTDDRTGTVPRFDPERAKFEATTELLVSAKRGEVERARQRSRAGDRAGHLDAYGALEALDAHIEADERSRDSQNESLKAIAKSKAAAEKKAKR